MKLCFAVSALILGTIHSLSLAKLTGTARWIPQDTLALASLHLEKILLKSDYLETREWKPILKRVQTVLPEFDAFMEDPNATGINLRSPMRIFIHGGQKDGAPIELGAILVIADKERVTQNLELIANKAKLKQREVGSMTLYQAEGRNFGIAMKGRTLALVGIAPGGGSENGELVKKIDQAARRLLGKPAENLPKAMKSHLSKVADLSLYADSEKFSKLALRFWPEDRWRNLLPIVDTLLGGKLAVRLNAYKGKLVLDIENPETELEEPKEKMSGLPEQMLDLLPGDVPLLLSLSIESEVFRTAVRKGIEGLLSSINKDDKELTLDTRLSGFDASANELLEAPSGHFAFALGSFRKNLPPPSAETPPSLPSPTMTLGIGISSEFALEQLIAGANAGNTLDALLAFNGLGISRKKGSIWIGTPEHRREIEMGRPLRKLSKHKRNLFKEHPIAMDLDLLGLCRSLRDAGRLPFETLKALDVLEEAKRVTMTGNTNATRTVIHLHDAEANGWQALGKHLAQEIIDEYNDDLFRAIAQNNATEVIKAVNEGVLVNAADRFGHSPMHYAAYKGNSSIVEYLLDRGGDPNARGRHDSTPLHSAAWGRNRRTLEVLLENGADVNARTDEGETPGMTASLRGEKETLEILLALSADPHAKDIHGTGLIEIAAAGGHGAIVDLLKQIGVKVDHPMHVAAGLGDLDSIKKFLKSGKDVNSRDGFGATPLLIATVAGQEEMVEFLLQKKADPSISAKDGYSLMHGAAFSGKKSLIRKALSLGMKINERYGPDGITPVDVANDDTDIAKYLRYLGGRTGWELGRP